MGVNGGEWGGGGCLDGGTDSYLGSYSPNSLSGQLLAWPVWPHTLGNPSLLTATTTVIPLATPLNRTAANPATLATPSLQSSSRKYFYLFGEL